MKTVKEYICELDTIRLVDTFFEEYGEKLSALYNLNNPECIDNTHIDSDESVINLSVYEYAQNERMQINDFITYLRGIDTTPVPNGKTGIIYAFSKYDIDIRSRWQVRLLFKEELLTDPNHCENHSFSAVKFSEVLGFLVADNKFTQDIIYNVLAFVIWKISLTGYRQQNNKSFFETYKKRCGKEFEFYEPIDERSLCFINDNPTMININETADSQKKLNDIRIAIYEYEKLTMERERQLLLKTLKE